MIPMLRPNRNNWTDSPMDLIDRQLRSFFPAMADFEEGDAIGAYPVDIREDEDHLYVEAEMPGFNKDQVNVTVENGVLNLTAERKLEETKGQTHLRQRRYTRIARSFTLPTEVYAEKVQARLEAGVLHLILPKKAEVKPRKIEVK